MSPTFPLAYFKRLFREDDRFITKSATAGGHAIGHGPMDMEECICDVLKEENFYKTMPSEQISGCWQDVYKVTFDGVPLYLKVQVRGVHAVLISYKSDTSVRFV